MQKRGCIVVDALRRRENTQPENHILVVNLIFCFRYNRIWDKFFVLDRIYIGLLIIWKK